MLKKTMQIIVAVLVAMALMAGGILVFLSLPIAGSNKILIVLSDSMRPAISAGSVVMSSPVKTVDKVVIPIDSAIRTPRYQVGDIVSFTLPGSKNYVTHRIAEQRFVEGKWVYRTKGDANRELDSQELAETRIFGKVLFSIPYLGYLLGFAKTREGLASLILFPAGFVIITEIINIIRELRKRRETTNQLLFPNSYFAPLNSLLLVVIFSLLIFHGRTFALFSNSGQSTNNIFAANTCFASGTHVVINEVFYDVNSAHQGSGTEGDWEWVELFNPINSAVDLTGWKIGDSGTSLDTFPGTPSLGPCSFAIISASSGSELEDQTASGGRWTIPDGTLFITLSSSIGSNGLSNTGDLVILKNNSDMEIDKMSYGTNTSGLNPAAPDVASGHSLERDPDGKDTDTASDFVNRATPTPGS